MSTFKPLTLLHIKGYDKLLSTSSDSFRYNSFGSTETKIKEFLHLLQDPEIKTFLKTFIEATLATSDLKILKRLAKVEAQLGLLEEDLLDEEDRASNLPYRLKTLEDKVNALSASNTPFLAPPTDSMSKTSRRAFAIVAKLRKAKKRFLTSSEIMYFLKHEIHEDLQITEDTCNPRETKKEVLEKAANLFPDVTLDKKPHGRREVRLVLS